MGTSARLTAAGGSNITNAIELIGFPGAGKTTHTEALLKWVSDQGIHVTMHSDAQPVRMLNGCRRTGRVAATLVRRPLLTTTAWRFSAGAMGKIPQSTRHWLQLVESCHWVTKSSLKRSDFVVLDESALQRLWKIAIRGSQPVGFRIAEAIAQQIADAARFNRWLVIHLDLDVDDAVGRLIDRKVHVGRLLPTTSTSGLMARDGPDRLRALWQKHATVFPAILSGIRRSPFGLPYRIDASQSAHCVQKKLQGLVARAFED